MKNFKLHTFLLVSGLLTFSPLCFGMNTQNEQGEQAEINVSEKEKETTIKEDADLKIQKEKLETNKNTKTPKYFVESTDNLACFRLPLALNNNYGRSILPKP